MSWNISQCTVTLCLHQNINTHTQCSHGFCWPHVVPCGLRVWPTYQTFHWYTTYRPESSFQCNGLMSSWMPTRLMLAWSQNYSGDHLCHATKLNLTMNDTHINTHKVIHHNSYLAICSSSVGAKLCFSWPHSVWPAIVTEQSKMFVVGYFMSCYIWSSMNLPAKNNSNGLFFINVSAIFMASVGPCEANFCINSRYHESGVCMPPTFSGGCNHDGVMRQIHLRWS